MALIEWAFNDEWENKVFLRWIAGHEFGMSFSDFLDTAKPVPIKTTGEIIADVENIIDSTTWRRADNGNI